MTRTLRWSWENATFLGCGSFDTVFKCSDSSTGEIFALKVFSLNRDDSSDAMASLQKEYHMMQKARHPNVATCHGWVHNLDGLLAALILDLAAVDVAWGVSTPLSLDLRH
jgi:serine/threonine protein kinase